MASVSWSDSKAGYDPGQSQTLKITFESRNIGKVKVSYRFYAKSLGRDDYVYNQRHNVVTIWVGGTSTSFTYQLHGNGASTTKTGTFYVNNVGNGVTSLAVQYKNDRVGTNTPYYGPKSTGVHSKSTIGYLSVPDNTKHNLIFDKGYDGNTVTNIPGSYYNVYKGTNVYIPNNILVDTVNHYVFNKGYSAGKSGAINLYGPGYGIGSLFQIMGDAALYGCWYPQTYRYRFFTNSSFIQEYSKLNVNYTYSTPAITLPNLNSLTNNNTNVNSEYYKVGYKFNGWNSSRGDINLPDLLCSFDGDTNFYPKWEPISSKITFNYGFDNYTRELPYTYDSTFDFSYALKDITGVSKSNTLLRPGYKLIGWTFDESASRTIYNPFDAPTPNYKYDAKTNVIYPRSSFSNREFEDNGLVLYAIWEYFTTMFIYDDNTWKLALPYVYIDSQWKIALSYDYAQKQSEQNPSWKL